MKRAKQINNNADPGGAIVSALWSKGVGEYECWFYALSNVRDCGSRAALHWLIMAGVVCPVELRSEFVHAFERLGPYRRKKHRPRKFNCVDRSMARSDWMRFCAEWREHHPDKAPQVGKWIETFWERMRSLAVLMGRPALTDDQLRSALPESTLRQIIREGDFIK